MDEEKTGIKEEDVPKVILEHPFLINTLLLLSVCVGKTIYLKKINLGLLFSKANYYVYENNLVIIM